jgi:hypothetical protein
VTYSKNELATRIIEASTPDTEMHPEFAAMFLDVLEAQLQLPRQ